MKRSDKNNPNRAPMFLGGEIKGLYRVLSSAEAPSDPSEQIYLSLLAQQHCVDCAVSSSVDGAGQGDQGPLGGFLAVVSL